ncbi:hypothetical protein EVAR_34211_1 [Eumeta japonica]|uniref:Uncharacterized protein n=1 Tax=Eumeta variegata TaxID=151549 RepID=A0A4C1WI35_EUMVA|nr:hypothetical protein EVAR_34211_1 [Eumeta japonica]
MRRDGSPPAAGRARLKPDTSRGKTEFLSERWHRGRRPGRCEVGITKDCESGSGTKALDVSTAHMGQVSSGSRYWPALAIFYANVKKAFRQPKRNGLSILETCSLLYYCVRIVVDTGRTKNKFDVSRDEKKDNNWNMGNSYLEIDNQFFFGKVRKVLYTNGNAISSLSERGGTGRGRLPHAGTGAARSGNANYTFNVSNWFNEFKHGRTNVTDNLRERRSFTVTTKDISVVRLMIQTDKIDLPADSDKFIHRYESSTQNPS